MITFLKKEKKFLIILTSLVSTLYITKLLGYGFTLNVSDSLPKGIYITENKNTLKKGDIVVLNIPKNLKILTSIKLDYSWKFLKKIVGIPGDYIEIKNDEIYINSVIKGKIHKIDSKGDPLESIYKNGDKFYLKKDEFFLMTNKDNSLDSRYFGVVKESEILKKAFYFN